jgi:hypothetical protein
MIVQNQKWNTWEKKGNRKNTVESSEQSINVSSESSQDDKGSLIFEFPHLDGDML